MILALVSSLCGILFLVPIAARDTSSRSLSARRLEAMHRWESSESLPAIELVRTTYAVLLMRRRPQG